MPRKKSGSKRHSAKRRQSGGQRKSSSRKQTLCERKKVARVMKEYKQRRLSSGTSKSPVRNRKQAIAIALSEARRYCE